MLLPVPVPASTRRCRPWERARAIACSIATCWLRCSYAGKARAKLPPGCRAPRATFLSRRLGCARFLKILQRFLKDPPRAPFDLGAQSDDLRDDLERELTHHIR